MKKSLIVIALLALVLPLSACSAKTSQDTEPQHQAAKPDPKVVNKSLVKKNRQNWDKKVKGTELIHVNNFTGDYIGMPKTLNDLLKVKDPGYALVKGTIYNLESMTAPKNMAFTKASIKVNQVLGGSKSSLGKVINLQLYGGLISSDVYYADMDRPVEANHELLVQNDAAPLPSIGSKVIICIVPFVAKKTKTSSIVMTDGMKKSGFVEGTAYDLDRMNQRNIWVKEPGADKYVMSSAMIQDKQEDDGENTAQMYQDLTNEINEKYNR